MKYAIACLWILIPIALSGQVTWKGYFQQDLGMEHNPLRNPRGLEFQNTSEEDQFALRPTTLVSVSKLYLNMKRKWDKLELGISPKISYRNYPGYLEGNALRGQLSQSLTYKPSREWRFYQRLDLIHNRRNGVDLATDLFQIPRSYQQFGTSLGTSYRVDRYWSIGLEVEALKRNFLIEEGESSSYLGLGGEAQLKRKFKKDNTLKYLTLTASWQHRNWERGRENETGDWQYSQTKFYYTKVNLTAKIALDDQLSWRPYLEYSRRDAQLSRQSWSGLKAGSSLKWKLEDWELNWSASVGQRDFPLLQENLEKGSFLQYWYLRNKLSLAHNFSPKLSALLTLQNIHRISNIQEETQAPRGSYDNLYLGLGVKLKF